MKVLELSAYFHPEQYASSYLWENLSDEYAAENIERVVCCPSPCRGISDEVRRAYKGKKKESMYGGKLLVVRFPLFKENKKTILRAIRYTISTVYMFVWSVFSKYAKNCDVIYVGSTPPIQGALGAMVKKVKKIPFCYCLQDIFPDSLVSTGMAKKNSLLWKIGRCIEQFAYRNADKIIVISEDFKNNLIAKGVPRDKIVVVYNWVDEQVVVDVPRKDNALFDRYNLERDKFYITYNGNIGMSQNMELLIDVAQELENIKDIHFVVVGEGAYKKRLKQIIANKKISNVTLLPLQPYEDISHVFSLGDVSLVISKPGVGSNAVPSKTWSIMSASRPVLANFDENELKSIIEKSNCGIFTKAGDKVAFTDAFLKLYNNRELCLEMGRKGRKFVMENLTREVGTQKYVDLIKSFKK